MINFDVFISYASQDKATADAACAKLEADGIRCWIAPRDVPPGAEWAGAIVDAIDNCRAMVLIFSSSANGSKQIHREVQRAFDREVPVVPFRIENIAPEKSLAYYMGPVHWLDALTLPLERHLQKLVVSVKPFTQINAGGAKSVEEVGAKGAEARRPAEQESAFTTIKRSDTVGALDKQPPKATRSSTRALLPVAALGAALLGSVGIWFADMYRIPVPAASTPVQPSQTIVATEPPPVSPPSAPAQATVTPISPPPVPAQAAVTPVQASGSVTPLSPERERALKPKDTFKECDKCPEMIVVPPGSFTMGSPEGEPGHMATEIPQHKVTIAKPFAVGRYAVTIDEWDACVADGGCNGYTPSDQGWGRGQRPVINVSWDNSKAYVAWLSKKAGKTYRLLSEAEREYVTRAGTTTPFWWGGSISTRQANYNGTSTYAGGSTGDYQQKTLLVNAFEPNPWGLYQVHGNVWDWVEDCQDENYSGAPSDGTAWTSGDCSRHVVRGGSGHSSPQLRRSAERGKLATEVQSSGIGFRVARTL
jgi:formylglycine-generating enzyme required for sulfatase activity